MIQKIKGYGLTLVALLTIAAPLAVPAVVTYADCSGIANSVANGADQAANGSPSSSCNYSSTVNNSTLTTIGHNVVNIFSILVGVVSIIMLIYGGFRYITSGGESGRVGNAKNTIIYAIIGLIIVAIAQVIVHFVLTQASSYTNSN